jgi:hypothetical protein
MLWHRHRKCCGIDAWHAVNCTLSAPTLSLGHDQSSIERGHRCWSLQEGSHFPIERAADLGGVYAAIVLVLAYYILGV